MGKGGPCQGHIALLVGLEGKERWGGWQLEASGATAVSRRGAAEGEGLFPGRSPSLLRTRPHGEAGGWQPPGQKPSRGPPQAGLVPSTASARSPLAPLPARGKGAGVWVRGPAGVAERDEGRFLKLYFSAGSFRVNELTS